MSEEELEKEILTGDERGDANNLLSSHWREMSKGFEFLLSLYILLLYIFTTDIVADSKQSSDVNGDIDGIDEEKNLDSIVKAKLTLSGEDKSVNNITVDGSNKFLVEQTI